MVGMYRIENTSSEHASVLKSTIVAWGEKQPDVYLVSKDGEKIYTQTILLGFYSKPLGELFELNRDEIVGANVPVSCASLTMLLKVLVSGSVLSNSKDELLEIGQAAEILGIELNNRQIGYRKKNVPQNVNKSMFKETVSINGRKVSYRKTSVSSTPSSKIKQEPVGEGSSSKDIFSKQMINSPLKQEELDMNTPGNMESNTCKYCQKEFTSKGKLKTHMSTHKDEKEKPFKCTDCDKEFASSTGLKTHKLLHTKEKLFKCEFCDYANVQKGNLKTHRLNRHRELIENPESLDKNEDSYMQNVPASKDIPEQTGSEEGMKDNQDEVQKDGEEADQVDVLSSALGTVAEDEMLVSKE